MPHPYPILHDYWRSSAAYRVRIALHLLDLPHEKIHVDLAAGEQHSPAYLELNKQGLVPTLMIDRLKITQSLAMIEYLHTTTSGSTLLPAAPLDQLRVRQLSHAIAMDVHPICNLSVVSRVAELAGGGEATKDAWMSHFISRGLAAYEAMLEEFDDPGPFSHGSAPSMADCCLIPQLYNADRYRIDYAQHRRICRVANAAAELPAFKAAVPEKAPSVEATH